MKTLIVGVLIFIFCGQALACSIKCEYPEGEQICNGYKLKDECKDKDIDVSNVLFLQCGYAWINDEAKKEYEKNVGCLERVEEKF